MEQYFVILAIGASFLAADIVANSPEFKQSVEQKRYRNALAKQKKNHIQGGVVPGKASHIAKRSLKGSKP